MYLSFEMINEYLRDVLNMITEYSRGVFSVRGSLEMFRQQSLHFLLWSVELSLANADVRQWS